MSVDRKRILDGLNEIKRICAATEMCGQCEITDICTRIDEAINEHKEIDPSKIKLPEE